MLHLIVGNTGAGKTSYAHQLKLQNHGIIFSIDTWNNTLFIPDKTSDDGLEWFLERIERSEHIMMDLIQQLETSDVDSILDLGLSKIAHREKFRKFAAKHGFEIKLHFLDVSKEIRMKRVLSRNEKQGKTFEFKVTQEDFEFMESWFEKPSPAELELPHIIVND